MSKTDPVRQAGSVLPSNGKIDVITAAAGLIPTLRARAAETDMLSTLPEQTVADFERACLFEMMVPKTYGGLQSSLETFLDTMMQIGRGDGAAAWTLALTSMSTWMAATIYPKHVIDQVFAQGANFRTVSAIAPGKAKMRRVAGGYVIEEGLWMYNSGVYHAQWDQLDIPLVDSAGEVIGRGVALVPVSDLSLLNDWDTIGLRGSGSASVMAKDVFVPEERICAINRSWVDKHGAMQLRSEAAYWTPAVSALVMRVVCPMLGMAKAATELFTDKIDTRGIAIEHQNHAMTAHPQISKATMKVHAAESIIRNSIRRLSQGVASGERMSAHQRARLERDASLASQMIWEGVDMLATASNAASTNRNLLMKQIWHDVRVASMLGGVACARLPGHRLTIGV